MHRNYYLLATLTHDPNGIVCRASNYFPNVLHATNIYDSVGEGRLQAMLEIVGV